MNKIKLTTRCNFTFLNLLPFFLIALTIFQIPAKGYHHFYKNGAVTKWRSFPVNFVVDNDSTTFQTQVQTAFTTWNSVATAKDILGARTNSTVDLRGSNFMVAWGNLTGDGQQELVFDADGTALQAAGLDPASTNGYGPSRTEADGTISDAYFIVNGMRTNFDRASTIVHELGHIQGLAHSSVGMHNSSSFPSEALSRINVNSVPTMHPFPAGSARQTLEADDIASLSELYPEPNFDTTFSTIEGKVTRCFVPSTTPVIGANIRAINKSNPNIQLSRFTSFDGNSDGRYLIKGVPAGNYQIIVEPMGANDFTINRFGNPPTIFETDFATEYLSADENSCPEEMPDQPADLLATAGTTLSGKDIKVQNVKLALVIDDTGSMSEEIAGVRSGMSSAITRIQQISQQTGESFPDVAIFTFKDNVTNRIVSNNPARLQSIIAGITASGGDDCPESANAALQAAGRLLRNGGQTVLATDADSRPDGPDRATIETQYRAKSLKLSTLLSGACTTSSSLLADGEVFKVEQECDIFQPSSNLEEYPLPRTLGVESSVRTYSEFAAETGGLFVYLPGVNTSSTVEKQRYANIAANLFVSSVAPAIGLVTPGDGIRGQTLSVEINGLTTNFQDSSQVSFGNGITVNSRTINSPEKITVSITVAPDANLGFRDVTVTTLLGSGTTEIATGVGVINITDPPPGPKLISITPTQGAQGSTLNVDVFGSNTNFINGTSVANFGAGITVNSTTVINSTKAVVNITVQNSAAIGLRDVTVTTGSEIAREDLPGPFLVITRSAVIARITAVNPNRGNPGQTLDVTITGENTNFVDGISTTAFSGTGITVNSTTVISSTSVIANITIASNAPLIFRDIIVTTGGESATGLNLFQLQETITPSPTPTVTPTPAVTPTPPDLTNCTFSLPVTSANFPIEGGTSIIVVDTQQYCTPSALYSAEYLTVGFAPGGFSLTVAANAGAARMAEIIILGQTFTVNQAGGKGRKRVRVF